jgi:hypothetical protein
MLAANSDDAKLAYGGTASGKGQRGQSTGVIEVVVVRCACARGQPCTLAHSRGGASRSATARDSAVFVSRSPRASMTRRGTVIAPPRGATAAASQPAPEEGRLEAGRVWSGAAGALFFALPFRAFKRGTTSQGINTSSTIYLNALRAAASYLPTLTQLRSDRSYRSSTLNGPGTTTAAPCCGATHEGRPSSRPSSAPPTPHITRRAPRPRALAPRSRRRTPRPAARRS